MSCACSLCLNKKFDSNVCIFCQIGLSKEGGRLRSKNGARVCTECIKKCNNLLIEENKKLKGEM